MRFAPVSLALSLVFAISASGGQSAPPEGLDPRAAALESDGKAALASGNIDKATDGFEAALAVQPGSTRLVLDLAEAARRQGMQGKALHYYRAVLARDAVNLDAIAGEGEALAEKGAIEKARVNLARLEGLCGKGCDAAKHLDASIAAALAKPAAPKVVSAEDVTPKATVAAD